MTGASQNGFATGDLGARVVLVTGAAGFFGLAITRALTRAGARVVAIDRIAKAAFMPRGGTVTQRLAYVQRTVGTDELDDLVAEADTIVHAAAITPPNGGGSEDAAVLFETNLGAITPLLQAAGISGSCTRLLFISSAAVYRQTRGGRLVEEDADGGDTLYGASKFAAEILGRSHAESLGLEFCAVRPTTLFGPGETERPSRPRITPFASLVRAARDGLPVSIRNAEARADWLSVDDAAAAVVALVGVQELPSQACNLSSGVIRPFSDVIAAVDVVLSIHIDEEHGVVIDGGVDRPAQVVNEQIRRVCSWKPTSALQETVTHFLESLDAK